MHKVNRLDIRFDNIDLLNRGNDQELEVEFFEEFQSVAGGVVGAFAKCLVDDYKTETCSFKKWRFNLWGVIYKYLFRKTRAFH